MANGNGSGSDYISNLGFAWRDIHNIDPPRRNNTIMRNIQPAMGPRMAEHDLMHAILRDGLRTLARNLGRPGDLARMRVEENLEWVRSDDTDYLYSFVNICDTLGMDPDYVRMGVERNVREGTTDKLRRKRIK